ncbi:hypothetical protein [Butyrivibrio sp. JL13D10]|uniref:hypothetical protein n=1 Tax=Butyrivibrio sp. JL13D10 TaxID=3236815 RepID=UPI0038B49991
MELALKYDNNRITDVHIAPTKEENVKQLYDLSQELLIKNPAVEFADKAKAGKFNTFSEDEYSYAIDEIAAINQLFYCADDGNKQLAEINIFLLLERLLLAYLRHIEIYIRDVKVFKRL